MTQPPATKSTQLAANPLSGLWTGYLSFSVFAGAVSLVLGLIYLIIRMGFTDQSLIVVKVIGFCWCLLFLPHGVRSVGLGRRWPGGEAGLTLIGLAVLVALGWVARAVGIDIALFIAATGAILAGKGLWDWRRRVPLAQALLYAGLVVLFSIWLASTVWEGHTTTPLLYEGLAVNRADNDPLFHASITNMIATFGIPSTGLDGVPRVAYHYGSHWLFAQLIPLLTTTTLTFYPLGFPIIFLPLLFKCLLTFALDCRSLVAPESAARSPQKWFWLVFLTATVGFFPRVIDNGILIRDAVFYSESDTVALALMLVGLDLLLSLARQPLRQRSAPLAIIGIPAFAAALGFSKVSLMLVLFAAGLYLAARLGWYRKPVWIVTCLLTAVAVALVLPYVNFGDSKIQPLYQYLNNLNKDFVLFWVVFGYLWLWLLIAIKLRHLNVRTVGDLLAALKLRRILDLEAVFVVGVVGLVPGNVLVIDGGSAFYFSDIQRWLAIALVLAYLPWVSLEFRPALRLSSSTRLAQILVTIFAAMWVIALVQNVWMPTSAMQTYNQGTRALLLQPPNPSPRPGRETLPDFLRYFNGSPVLASLQSVAALPRKQKRDTLLFIPLSNAEYWTLLKPCYYVPFVAPAVTGMAMLQGLPDAPCQLQDFLFQFYQRPATQERLAADDKTAICAAARNRGFGHVIQLTTGDTGQVIQTRFDCATA